jgi:hypothetical protein
MMQCHGPGHRPCSFRRDGLRRRSAHQFEHGRLSRAEFC